jgi:SNF2 family DNA or RNA helicase
VEASLKALGLPNLSTLLPGMEVALMPHQVIGVDWMLKQESCTTRRGGILADEMGLVSPSIPYYQNPH